jgi:hypothetical protein
MSRRRVRHGPTIRGCTLLSVTTLDRTCRVQRMTVPGSGTTWTVLGGDHVVVGPAEEFLEFLRVQGSSPGRTSAQHGSMAWPSQEHRADRVRQGRGDNQLGLLVADRPRPAGPRLVGQPSQPLPQEPAPPLRHHVPRNAQLSRHGTDRPALGVAAARRRAMATSRHPVLAVVADALRLLSCRVRGGDVHPGDQAERRREGDVDRLPRPPDGRREMEERDDARPGRDRDPVP